MMLYDPKYYYLTSKYAHTPCPNYLKEDHYLRMVIFYAAFSLISAVLYYFFNAPDVAMAELAIGCAFVPLMFIIAISKQREFIIIYHPLGENFVEHFAKRCKYEYDLLYIFCLENKLSFTRL